MDDELARDAALMLEEAIMANHLGKKYRAEVPLGGIEIEEGEEFVATAQHLAGADFDSLVATGAVTPLSAKLSKAEQRAAEAQEKAEQEAAAAKLRAEQEAAAAQLRAEQEAAAAQQQGEEGAAVDAAGGSNGG